MDRPEGAATLEQLRVLVAVAQAGSFSDAARTLERSPSAVSQSIASLEDHLGLALFDRSQYRAVLNADGQRFVARARRVIEEAEAFEDEARAPDDDVEPHLAIAFDEYVPSSRLADALGWLRARYPAVVVDLQRGDLGRTAELVRTGVAAIAVCGPRTSPWPRGLAVEPVASLERVSVVRSDHELTRCGEPVPASALRAVAQIVTPASSLDPVRSDVSLSAASLAAQRLLALAGMGWATLPRHIVAADLDTGLLRPIAVSKRPKLDETAPLFVVHRRRPLLGRAGRALVQWLARPDVEP
jgi:DNA-binding transcriptional LysR family regulator